MTFTRLLLPADEVMAPMLWSTLDETVTLPPDFGWQLVDDITPIPVGLGVTIAVTTERTLEMSSTAGVLRRAVFHDDHDPKWIERTADTGLILLLRAPHDVATFPSLATAMANAEAAIVPAIVTIRSH